MRSSPEHKGPASPRQMLGADLIAERIATESYRDMIAFIGERDPTSRHLLESMLAEEEEHDGRPR